ncbi:hypothetical protein SDC9_97026 [bioreactor metagenome]|uniref:Uncharacterized protein n=1 Tax=bioreactor metagenome TaxID=1076179 RepID=A0A645AB95_9ZZZZ
MKNATATVTTDMVSHIGTEAEIISVTSTPAPAAVMDGAP